MNKDKCCKVWSKSNQYRRCPLIFEAIVDNTQDMTHDRQSQDLVLIMSLRFWWAKKYRTLKILQFVEEFTTDLPKALKRDSIYNIDVLL